MNKIKAIIKRADEQVGHVTYISDSLENLQRTVGGFVECVPVAENLFILCNEDGRWMGLPYNCMVNGIAFVGDIIVVGENGEHFGDCPISLAEWKELLKGVARI